jgi:four helix bundle protein
LSPKSVHDLDVWRDAISLVTRVYTASKAWPRDELYGLTNQARIASVSIPTNLAEGRGRGTPGEIRRFAQIAIASAYELDTLLVIANELGYPPTDHLRDSLSSIIRRIQSYIRYQESRSR